MKRCLNCMEEYGEELNDCPACGHLESQEKGPWLEPGNILQGRYIVGALRFRSSVDFLYIGWDALFSRKVMIQEFFPQYCVGRNGELNVRIYDSKAEYFKDGKSVFIQDGLNQIILDDTPNMLNVFSVFEENHTAYITMEYPGEMSLYNFWERHGPFHESEMLRLIQELIVPLKKAHELQTYHGEITLDCCFADDSGNFKLGCFKEARYLCAEPRADTERMEPPSARADVYGLADLAGVVLFGEELWEDSTSNEREKMLEESCSTSVTAVLKRSLNENPSMRPESVEEFSFLLFGEEKTLDFNPGNKKRGKRELFQAYWLVILCLIGVFGLFLVVVAFKLIFH